MTARTGGEMSSRMMRATFPLAAATSTRTLARLPAKSAELLSAALMASHGCWEPGALEARDRTVCRHGRL